MKIASRPIAAFVLTIVIFGTLDQKVIAQTSGAVSELVTDAAGAVVPDANLVLRNVATGDTRNGITAGDGQYTFASVPPGTYTLTTQKPGFTVVTVENLIVQVNTPVRRDVTLTVAAVSQAVTVQASPVAVNSESASLGEVITAEKIVQLPLNGRNFLQLATLSPGVNPPATQNGQSTTQNLGGGRSTLTVSISGSREISPDFLFDGIPSRHDYYGAVGIEPPVDSIAEFKIQRGYFSPQFGQPGVINLVLKSGTNSVHGAAWEFFRNDVLDARNFFDSTKAPYKQNQFGFDIGGPAVKNKLFWFGDYEGQRIRQSGSSFAFVPSQAELQGDFTGGPTIYDPSTYDPTTNTRQSFSNNVIPANRISPFATLYNRFIPAPNSQPLSALGGANLVGQTLHKLDDTKYDIKVDYVQSEKDKFFGEFSFLNSDESDTSLLPYQGSNSPLHSRHPVLGWTHIFSPTLLNDFRAGLDRVFLSSEAPEQATSSPNWATVFGFTNLNGVQDCNAVPAVSMSGLGNFGFSFANCIITGNSDYHFADNLSYTKGPNTITTGVHVNKVYLRDLCAYAQDGSFAFTGQYTNDPGSSSGGSSVADYLLGVPFSASGTKFPGPFYRLGWWTDAYVNDDLKVSSKLTLNLGLRWQFTQPLVEKYDNLTTFNYQTGQVIKAGTPGYPRSLLTSRYTDFAPRVGFAYSPATDWAVRGSYGIFYDRLPGNEWSFQTTDPPVESGFSFVGGSTVPSIDLSTLFPSSLSSLNGIALFNLADRKDPYLQQWTLSVQRTLPSNILAEIAYVGSKGTYLSKRLDINLAPSPPAAGDTSPPSSRSPYPNYGFILDDQGRATSEYEALQMSLRKALSHGLTVLSGYTWGRSMDNDSFDSSATRNYRPGDLDHARSAFDLRQRFVTSFVYGLPFGQGLHGLTGQLAKGWQITGILTLQTGLPFTVLTFADPSNTGAIFGGRPNRVCNGNLPTSKRTPQEWFDTSCFTMPAQNTYGNGGVGYLDTDGTRNLDFSIIKDFTFLETQNIQFRAEAFNVLNNVVFNAPGSYLDGGGFGSISSARSGRIIQFGMKYAW